MSARFLVLYGTPHDVEAFERHYREVHVPLARALPGLRRYTLGRDVRAVRGDRPTYLVAELEWDDMTALQGAFASEEGRAAAADMATLTGLADVQSMIYEVTDA
jgi:uncharacterized protein (TIGR02118 family)